VLLNRVTSTNRTLVAPAVGVRNCTSWSSTNGRTVSSAVVNGPPSGAVRIRMPRTPDSSGEPHVAVGSIPNSVMFTDSGNSTVNCRDGAPVPSVDHPTPGFWSIAPSVPQPRFADDSSPNA
jgi:hypothetical protein